MKYRSRGLVKKLHGRWLNAILVDVSQDRRWRKRLFESASGEVFFISFLQTSGLSRSLVNAVRKYRLCYSASVAPSHQAEPWLGEDGNVVFRFWASEFPSVRAYSGNNPEVV